MGAAFLLIATLFGGQQRAYAAVTQGTIAVTNVPATAEVGTSFTIRTEITSFTPGSGGGIGATWGGYNVQLEYNSSVLQVNGVTSGGVCALYNSWSNDSLDPVHNGCAFQDSTTVGVDSQISVTCITSGASTLHFLTVAEDVVNGTTLFDTSAVNIPTTTIDATILCRQDSDGDGIDDSIDTAPATPSLNFSDTGSGGTTSGRIESYDLGIVVTVSDLPDPAGVLVSASGDGTEWWGAIVSFYCTPTFGLWFNSGDSTEVTCGSDIVHVDAGPVHGVFGTLHATLPAGAAVTAVQSAPGVVDVTNDLASSAPIVVGGVTIAAGATVNGLADSDSDGLADVVETNTGVYVSPGDTGTNPNVADTDGDGLSDGVEVVGYGSSPLAVDTDTDGCGDAHEITFAGLSPTDPYDFYSVPVPALFSAPNPLVVFSDSAVGAGDAQAVFAYFKKAAKTGSTEYEQDLNANGIKDGVEYDRTVIGPGHSGPPDGVVGAADAQLAFAQFKLGYHC